MTSINIDMRDPVTNTAPAGIILVFTPTRRLNGVGVVPPRKVTLTNGVGGIDLFATNDPQYGSQPWAWKVSEYWPGKDGVHRQVAVPMSTTALAYDSLAEVGGIATADPDTLWWNRMTALETAILAGTLKGDPGPAGPAGSAGPAGLSAYNTAVANGFVGTEVAWLASLVGPQGPAGSAGPVGPAGSQGTPGTTGAAGLSAYQVAVIQGFVGTEVQWLASLQGANGAPGAPGATGADGPRGPQGIQGVPGADGAGSPATVASPDVGGTAVIGTSTNFARQDHIHGVGANSVGASQIQNGTVGWLKLSLDDGDIPQAKVNGLVAGLAGKAATVHGHAQADVTGLTASLAAKADLVGGVLPTSQLPSLAVVDFLGTVATQSAMLALVGQKGDWAIRSDLGTSWVITGADPTLLTNWTQLSYPTAPVASVNSQTGAVVLSAANVGAPPTARQVIAGTGLTGGGDLAADRTLAVAYGTTAGTAVQGNDTRVTLAVPNTRQVIAGTGLTGGGDLTADRTLTVAYGTTSTTAARGDLAATKASPALTGTTTVEKFVTTPVTITFAASLVTNAALGNYFRTTLTANATLAVPTNPTDGQKVIWEFIQDATGGRTLTLATGTAGSFLFGTDLTSITLTTTAGKRDLLGAVYNAALGRWLVNSFMKGF